MGAWVGNERLLYRPSPTEEREHRYTSVHNYHRQFTYGGNMNTDYKGYTIITASERDDASGLWNGRYRIMDDEGIVVYESFVEPLHDEEKAYEAANVAARAWIDEQ